MSLRALVLSQGADRKVSGLIETLPVDRLPAGDVTVAVEFSTLNYKDGLVLTTGGGLVKTWLMSAASTSAALWRRPTIQASGRVTRLS